MCVMWIIFWWWQSHLVVHGFSHIHMSLLCFSRGWPIRIHRIYMDADIRDRSSLSLPVFAVVVTKFRSLPNMPQVRLYHYNILIIYEMFSLLIFKPVWTQSDCYCSEWLITKVVLHLNCICIWTLMYPLTKSFKKMSV